jgi:hypothetical protein
MTHEEFWNQEPPYFLRRVLNAHAKAIQDAEEKEAAKKAKKAAKLAGVPVEVVAVAAGPKPLGYVWVCERCKAAPPKYKDYPNNYKWKTEKGFLGHKCLG